MRPPRGTGYGLSIQKRRVFPFRRAASSRLSPTNSVTNALMNRPGDIPAIMEAFFNRSYTGSSNRISTFTHFIAITPFPFSGKII